MNSFVPNVRTVLEATSEPMQVRNNIILECRKKVETRLKARIRTSILPLIKWSCKAHSIGEGFQWGRPFSARDAKIGRYVYIARGCDFSGRVVIGDLTMASTNCVVLGRDHIFDDVELPMRYNFPAKERPETVIGADVWLGHGVILMEGIRIGRGSIIAAASVVTSDVPPYSIFGGIPARKIRDRFSKDNAEKHDQLLYDQELLPC